MDVNTITQLVSGVGFPIVCCAVLFKQNGELQQTLTEISNTLQTLSERIRNLEAKDKEESKMATVAQMYHLVNDAAKEALGSKAIAVKDTT